MEIPVLVKGKNRYNQDYLRAVSAEFIRPPLFLTVHAAGNVMSSVAVFFSIHR